MQVLKADLSLEDVHSFGCTCRSFRRLLEGESSDLFSPFCPGSCVDPSLRIALSYHKLGTILAKGRTDPKPCTFYHRFQASAGLEMDSADVTPLPKTGSEWRAIRRMCTWPNFFKLIELGSLPSGEKNIPFTLTRKRGRNAGCFLVLSECGQRCLYQVEFEEGRIMRILERTSLPSSADPLEEVLRKVYTINRVRTEIVGKVSIQCLHQSSAEVTMLCRQCGIEELRTRSCGDGAGGLASQNFIVALTLSNCWHSSRLPSVGRRAGGSVGSLYRKCSQIKEVQQFLSSRPENLEQLVIYCSSPKVFSLSLFLHESNSITIIYRS